MTGSACSPGGDGREFDDANAVRIRAVALCRRSESERRFPYAPRAGKGHQGRLLEGPENRDEISIAPNEMVRG